MKEINWLVEVVERFSGTFEVPEYVEKSQIESIIRGLVQEEGIDTDDICVMDYTIK